MKRNGKRKGMGKWKGLGLRQIFRALQLLERNM
jgi:hypothetical protein